MCTNSSWIFFVLLPLHIHFVQIIANVLVAMIWVFSYLCVNISCHNNKTFMLIFQWVHMIHFSSLTGLSRNPYFWWLYTCICWFTGIFLDKRELLFCRIAEKLIFYLEIYISDNLNNFPQTNFWLHLYQTLFLFLYLL